jgi:parvulin-like peptidyl-prolyl isomerase
MLLASVFGSGAPPHAAAEQTESELIVARVDNRPITVAQLQQEMRRQKLAPASALENDYYKQQALDTLLTDLAVRLEAEQMDFSNDYTVRTVLRQNLMQLAANLYIDEVVAPRLAVTENDVRTYWKEHPEQFTVRGLMINPQQIMINLELVDQGGKKPPEEYDGWTAEDLSADLYRRLKRGEDWDALARRYSNDARSRGNGGQLGWQTVDSTAADSWLDSLASFPVGITMPPFEVNGALYIVRIIGRRNSGTVIEPDAAMKTEVGKYIGNQRMNAWTRHFRDSVVAAGELVIIDTTLDLPIDDLPDGLPMAVSNHADTTFGCEFRTQSHFFTTEDGSRNFSRNDRRRLLESLHELLSIFKAMRDLGYLDRPELQKAKQDYLTETGRSRILAAADDRYTPSEEEIAQYYREHLAEFLPERPVHVQHIVLDNLDTAWVVKRRIDAGADFVQVALEYYQGDPEMAEVTYDLGFIAADDLPSQFFSTAMSTEEGAISAPVQTEWGYHLIRVVEFKPGTPLEKARTDIRSRLNRRHKIEAFQAWREQLLGRHEIKIDTEALAAVPLPEASPADSAAQNQPGARPGP